MENRREHFRHNLDPEENIIVELEIPKVKGKVVGNIVNLCLEGMGVQITSIPDGINLKPRDRLKAKFELPIGNIKLQIECSYVHTLDRVDHKIMGFQFLPWGIQREIEARERNLWTFLLAAQRRHRERKKEQTATT